MSVFFVQGKGWRWDFTLKGTRHTGAWFETKKQATKAMTKAREEALNPTILETKSTEPIPKDMGFKELLNRRLDYVKVYNSQRHYTDHVYLAKRWAKLWENHICSEVTGDMIQSYLLKRARQTSGFTANKELRYLRAVFNFGMHPIRDWIKHNPTRGIQFFPVDKRIKYVPPKEDVLRVILAAPPDVQDYLWTIALTMGRMSEINRLTWQEVNLVGRHVILYTRKKRGGHRTPRKVPMNEKLYSVLSHRHANRKKDIPWVFWHKYWSRRQEKWIVGPFEDRNSIMTSLCTKAGVNYFRYHALRHFGASLMEQANVPIGSIQRILGHENRATTEIYLHSIGDSEREAMRVLNDGFESFSHMDSHMEKKGATDRNL
jgi:integrase